MMIYSLNITIPNYFMQLVSYFMLNNPCITKTTPKGNWSTITFSVTPKANIPFRTAYFLLQTLMNVQQGLISVPKLAGTTWDPTHVVVIQDML